MSPGPWSITWRIATALTGLTLLLLAQLHPTNDWFPLTIMEQFAAPHDPEGTVASTCLTATAQGRAGEFPVSFGSDGVGVQRSDVEVHLRRLRSEPQLPAQLAQRYARLHPERPALTSLSICQDVTHLHRGAPSGRVDHVVLATWRAP